MTPEATWESLEPANVWNIFAGIAAVPRPSGKEEKIRRHVLAFAREHRLEAKEDAAGNILIQAPATPGHEKAPTVVLQGHMDMVCEKNSGTVHDFDNDPIRLVVDRLPETGEVIVRADGTTLGADNGIGLALALAAATDPKVVHGPIEILCTVDEEVGLNGAQRVAKNFFTGKMLLNLDSEGDDTLTIGCAGGCDTTVTWVLAPRPLPPDTGVYEVKVRGLQGGHSGADVHKNLGNANRILVRALRQVEGIRLLSIEGGSKRNAISREARALVAASSESALRAAASLARDEAIREHGERDCVVEVAAGAKGPALSAEDTDRVLTALDALPHGVIMMEPMIPDLVRSSTNLATIGTESSPEAMRITVALLSRSSSMIQLHDVVRQIEAVARLSGAHAESANEYTGWKPDVSSRLLRVCRSVYKELYGEEPKVAGIHAGLECGILSEKVDGCELISLGVKITGAHSPDERVYVGSLQKGWKYLTAILGELARA